MALAPQTNGSLLVNVLPSIDKPVFGRSTGLCLLNHVRKDEILVIDLIWELCHFSPDSPFQFYLAFSRLPGNEYAAMPMKNWTGCFS